DVVLLQAEIQNGRAADVERAVAALEHVGPRHASTVSHGPRQREAKRKDDNTRRRSDNTSSPHRLVEQRPRGTSVASVETIATCLWTVVRSLDWCGMISTDGRLAALGD